MNAIAMCSDIGGGVGRWSDSRWGPQCIVSVNFLYNYSLGKLQQCPNLHFFFFFFGLPFSPYNHL